MLCCAQSQTRTVKQEAWATPLPRRYTPARLSKLERRFSFLYFFPMLPLHAYSFSGMAPPPRYRSGCRLGGRCYLTARPAKPAPAGRPPHRSPIFTYVYSSCCCVVLYTVYYSRVPSTVLKPLRCTLYRLPRPPRPLRVPCAPPALPSPALPPPALPPPRAAVAGLTKVAADAASPTGFGR